MPKPRLCKCGCGSPIPSGNTLRKAATVECALRLGRISIERKKERERIAERREIKERKIKVKSLADWMSDVQKVFNAYIRERDRDLPCISCGTFNPNIQYCAGHFLTRGAHPELRFEPLNVHKQCNKSCNLEKSGNQQQYRIGLLMRIGEEKVLWLEGPHPPKKYTIDDLKALKSEYKQKLKDLKTNPVYPVI